MVLRVLLVQPAPLVQTAMAVQQRAAGAAGMDGATGPTGPAGADGADGAGAAPIQDEGTAVVATPTAINFVGNGVVVTNVGGVATVTIAGGAMPPTTHATVRGMVYRYNGRCGGGVGGRGVGYEQRYYPD